MKQTLQKNKEIASFSTLYPDLCNLDAEQAVIGGLLLSQDNLDLLSGLEPYHFYHYRHQEVFEILQKGSQQNKPGDLILVIEQLRTQKKIQTPEDETYLWELANGNPPIFNWH